MQKYNFNYKLSGLLKDPKIVYFCQNSKQGMARLGRQVDHFINIRTDSISADFSSDRKHRYTLRMDYIKDLLDRERDRTVTVILKNPSSADEKRSDSTIRKVETYVWKKFPDAGKLNIYNLFAYRATDAVELHKLITSEGLNAGVGADNDKFLVELLGTSDYLICAWGGPSAINKHFYRERISQVRGIIKSAFSGPVFEVRGLQETSEPLHGLMWGYDYQLTPLSL